MYRTKKRDFYQEKLRENVSKLKELNSFWFLSP